MLSTAFRVALFAALAAAAHAQMVPSVVIPDTHGSHRGHTFVSRSAYASMRLDAPEPAAPKKLTKRRRGPALVSARVTHHHKPVAAQAPRPQPIVRAPMLPRPLGAPVYARPAPPILTRTDAAFASAGVPNPWPPTYVPPPPPGRTYIYAPTLEAPLPPR